MIRNLINGPFNWMPRAQYCTVFRTIFLTVALLGLVGQVLYDQHLKTALSIFPQWLLLGSIWYAGRQRTASQDDPRRSAVVFALLIPALSCLTLVVAWLGWKANTMAICGVIPVSDSASYFISAQTFLREGFLDASGQRRPLNIVMTSLWTYLSAGNFKLLLLVQALIFSAAAFFASAATAARHGIHAGLLLFAFILVFAEPYLPTMLSETNGMIFGMLALVGFIFGLYGGSLFMYGLGALFLAIGFAIRPSALFVLPCIAVAGAVIFGASRIGRLAVFAALTTAVLLPSGVSIVLNKTVSHGDGALNSNLSYVVYGLVTGGRGWEQYQKDNPGKLDGLPEAERSRVILAASRQHFEEHPIDLVRGLIKGQFLGPVQSFAQIVRLAFLGAAGDPLRIIPPAAIIVISLCFAGILSCRWLSKAPAHASPADDRFRLFCIWFLGGYLVSIPFFYQDGGLRLHAVVLPVLSYMLVRALLAAGAPSEDDLSKDNAIWLRAGALAFGFGLLGLLGWISLAHPKSRDFDLDVAPASFEQNKMTFQFKPGWPQCDLRNFDPPRARGRLHWFSGAIPDDDYRSAGLGQISGRGRLYFGFDTGARDWKIIHTDQPVGLLNRVTIGARSHGEHRDNIYRDFYSAETVEVIDANAHASR
jgi:hypothetical protein